MTPPKPRPIPERFRVSGLTLLVDRFMTCTIIGGGMMVIACVMGIFLFILAETLPLFGGADFRESTAVTKPEIFPLKEIPDMKEAWTWMGNDESKVYFYHNFSQKIGYITPPLPEGQTLGASRWIPRDEALALSTKKGDTVLWKPDAWFTQPPSWQASVTDAGTINNIECAAGDSLVTFLLLSEETGGLNPLLIVSEEGQENVELSLPGFLGFDPVRVELDAEGGRVAVLNEKGDLYYLNYDDDDREWNLIQIIQSPFGAEKITSLAWAFGGNSLITGGDHGGLKVYSIYPRKNEQGRNVQELGETKSFDPMLGAVTLLASSPVNRTFFAATDRELRICYTTTDETRWQSRDIDFKPVKVNANNNFTQILITDDRGVMHQFTLDDKHPEAGSTAFFGKIRYEGYAAPEWQWQSVGGSDEYEPKLSLVPLIFGTFKGTFYALLFAVPIALLAAIYTAHFMSARMKRIVKPTMEIMASLPSVVLGFFGALYLAPLLEDKVPALICLFILVPLATMAMGMFWASRSVSLRNKFGGGLEYLVLILPIFVMAWFSWSYLGEWLEPGMVRTALLFTGSQASDLPGLTFPDLWRSGFGFAYEQRNSLVVGFVMGFAVIPVIFTIAEDALANVPASLLHASEALGASRWQVVRTIVLPIAAAGIFSALMIGFGRAVGETMIVLMATGNTPVMDWNIFNGMRTLSANIATELPEAAEHSTHYRVLFLCGFILFLMTFVLNTAAELLRQRLREKYKVI